jgi:hypothetical protein
MTIETDAIFKEFIMKNGMALRDIPSNPPPSGLKNGRKGGIVMGHGNRN